MSVFIISSVIPPEVSGAGVRALRTAVEIAKHKEVIMFSRIKNSSLSIPHLSILTSLYSVTRKPYSFIINILDIIILPFCVLFRFLTIRRPDIIHSFSVSWLTIYMFIYNKIFWGKPFIIELTLMGSDTPNSETKWWVYRKLSDYCIKRANKINCISPLLYEYMVLLGYDTHKLALIPNSFDDRFQPGTLEIKNLLRENYDLNNGEFIIITVGGVTLRKGYPLLKEIVKCIDKSIPFRVISIGNFSSKSQVKLKNSIIKELKNEGLDDKLVFIGYKDPLPYLQLSDLFLFLSDREGFGSAVIEAMACGLPVICKKIEKITEFIVNDGKDGYILDSTNPRDFANKIGYLFNNPMMRKEIGLAAIESVQKRFSVNKICKNYLDLYESL
jgi:glycosyltransferase involved in cell wall biosynthesis